VSLHTLPGELTSRHCCTCTGLWFDPSWTMGVLYMALLEAPTCKCWILFETTHFGCALGLIQRHHPQVYVCWQTNLLFTYTVKNYLYNTVWGYSLPHRIQHTVQSLTQNLHLHFNANQIKFPLWEFEFSFMVSPAGYWLQKKRHSTVSYLTNTALAPPPSCNQLQLTLSS